MNVDEFCNGFNEFETILCVFKSFSDHFLCKVEVMHINLVKIVKRMHCIPFSFDLISCIITVAFSGLDCVHDCACMHPLIMCECMHICAKEVPVLCPCSMHMSIYCELLIKLQGAILTW